MKLLSIFIMLWNYVFERSFNLFDVFVFGFIWRANYTWDTWQFWAVLVPGMIVSAIGSDINRKFKSFHD